MSLKTKITEFSVNHYKIVFFITILITIVSLTQFPKMAIDTDPENMLSENEFVRVFDKQVKKEFAMYDIIVLGAVNEYHKNGVFNKETLEKLFNITEKIKKIDGVVSPEIMSLSTVDDIKQGGSEGEIKFERLMGAPPANDSEAAFIGLRAKSNPILDGSIISENGKAVCVYVPIKEKKISYRTAMEIRSIIKEFGKGNEKYYITGLPVAEDTFGVEMFKQMAMSAPLAGAIIFLLMLYFFKKIKLIISPMIVAMVSIICSMGLMIGLGYSVHIMSSMIAIFLMPISVVDSVHIISDFFEKYQIYKDRKKTILVVIDELFSPMLYTSLTSFAGFVSLATAPIPPVQVFGFFVGFGIIVAFILTITFVPASIMFISEKTLENFGAKKISSNIEIDETNNNNLQFQKSFYQKLADFTGRFIFNNSKLIISLTFIIAVIAVIGITKIRINDNPVKWFDKKHEIRIADKELNKHFSGTYMASLILEADTTIDNLKLYYNGFNSRLENFSLNYQNDSAVLNKFKQLCSSEFDAFVKARNYSFAEFHKSVSNSILPTIVYEYKNPDSNLIEELTYFMEDEKIYTEPFKQPELLEYADKLQTFMNTVKVGKSNSISTIVKKINQELRGGKTAEFRIPENPKMIGECLIQFQSSHRPNDLWHFVTYDYNKINIWVQLKSGDNTDMTEVINQTNQFISRNPPPYSLKINWAGKTYLNVVWQDKMVFGMLTNSLLSSFITVLIMMIILFRSIWLGILSMIPLTVTITFIYGLIGFIGKDYDMPVAILSSLTLGVAVDFAIHFIERFKQISKEEKNFEKAFYKMFDEPATAITRNIIVIALGFLPLLLSPLVPYQTVGFFLTAIMIVSGIGTILILPAIMKDIIRDFKDL
ncbi:MAG TPA: MMPL family transporter [bacterium]|nr:MMPL family transporter [bacterium]HPN30041.1 MMPL family transporter [bacterium]